MTRGSVGLAVRLYYRSFIPLQCYSITTRQELWRMHTAGKQGMPLAARRTDEGLWREGWKVGVMPEGYKERGGGWTEAQAGDKRGNWGNRTEDRMKQKVALADQMLWSCCTQVFSKGITSENRGGGYFIYTTREQGKQKTEQKKTTVYICVNYSS